MKKNVRLYLPSKTHFGMALSKNPTLGQVPDPLLFSTILEALFRNKKFMRDEII